MYRLLIECPDQKGLIYKITQILSANNLNIERNDEFVDKEVGRFFMRTEISGNVNEKILLADIQSAISQATIRLTNSAISKRIVILVTKESHCIGDILIRHFSGELDAQIVEVIGNHNELAPLVEKFGIPYRYIPHDNISREVHENQILQRLEEINPDIIVLAKYMRVLTSSFVEPWEGKILNIHHSFLPAFIGANPYKQAYERGVKIIGATAHFVNNHLDEGPIIAQNITPVNHTLSWQDMRNAGRDVEKVVLSHALKLLLEDRVFVYTNKTVIFS